MAHGYRLEAEYQSGFVLKEDAQDHSPYDAGKNIFHAIRQHRPEAAHGPLVRFSAIGPAKRYDIDWTTVPAGAEPLMEYQMERDFHPELGWTGDPRAAGYLFGYELDGQRVVKELD